MAGLSGLGKNAAAERLKRLNENDEAAEAFIRSAPLASPKQAEPQQPSAPKAKRKVKQPSLRRNFSLEDSVSKDIDKLSLMPRSFKASRSDVIRAGVKALMAMRREEVIELLRSVAEVESDVDEDAQHG